MNFSTPSLVADVVWRMRQADIPRGTNRAAIDRLFNGSPPLTEQERIAQNAHTNYNDLSAPKLAADARRTYYGAYLKPPVFFNVTLENGDTMKRGDWGRCITTKINRIMKQNKGYFELLRSQLALTVLHGIGPVFWADRQKWCPECIGIEDVLIPANTTLAMKNLSHFAIWRQYTPMELKKITGGVNVDPGWNMKQVDAALKWAESQTSATNTAPDFYAPEKMEQRWKSDSGYYGTDAVPTINAWDFYFWSDEKNKAGWRRRMILETPTSTGALPEHNGIGQNQNEWLYCPDNSRIYGDSIEEVMHFQFGDASAVAPFRYHSVRSLGWLLYSVCHLQNRVKCKLNDAIFESFMQYFRVANPDDHERITKIDLHNFGVIPEGVTMLSQNDRWQVNSPLAQQGLSLTRERMNEAGAQFREGRDAGDNGKEKTATQVMAEVNAANALVGSMLLQSYEYSKSQYREICRRFCIKNSSDLEVREFRLQVLKAGVPEELLNVSLWNIEPERAMGSGNKILEVAMADKLMAVRQLLDAPGQREVLHRYIAANSDQPDYADRIVPNTPEPSKTAGITQLMLGTLMQGIDVAPMPGLNPAEVIPTLLQGAAMILSRLKQSGLPTMSELVGLKTVEKTIGQWLQILSQDKTAMEAVKAFASKLQKLSQILQMMEQEVQNKAQQEQQGQGSGEVPPVDAAKIATIVATAKAKIQTKDQIEQQKLQQKDAQFKSKIQQQSEQHDANLNKTLKEVQLTAMTKGIESGERIKERLKLNEEDALNYDK